jgi:PelA/Pel-15E family pectate lyase
MTRLAAVVTVLLAWSAVQAPLLAQDDGFFSPERLASLPDAERTEWLRYLDQSAEDASRDLAAMERELQRVDEEELTPAPQRRTSLFRDEPDPTWFAGDEARRIADILLSYQTPSGGWSKNIDFRKRPRRPGESFSSGSAWSYIGTFDNDATTEQVRFLGKTYLAQGGDQYREGFLRGLRFTLRAQFPNGCWPQVYPLQGGYHDAATYNDEAIPNVLELLRRIAAGEFSFVDAELQEEAGRAVGRGTACILASQVVVDGTPTAWAQQYDPLSLHPVQARAYEHASLTAGESVEVVEFLMEIEHPPEDVIRAVYAAVDWFEAVALYGLEYNHPRLIKRESAGPVWARFYEIGTNRPIFSNRDGVIVYDWHEVDEERRRGYAWYRYGPAEVLARFPQWSARNPRPE